MPAQRAHYSTQANKSGAQEGGPFKPFFGLSGDLGRNRVDVRKTARKLSIPHTTKTALCGPQAEFDNVSYFLYNVSMRKRNKRPGGSEAGGLPPLGEFEQLVLMAVIRLGSEAYGMKIHQVLETTAGRKSSFGALYTTLDRLEDKGYVSSSVGESTPERGGRAKKYFQIEAPGSAALRESLNAISRMAKGLKPSMGAALLTANGLMPLTEGAQC